MRCHEKYHLQSLSAFRQACTLWDYHRGKVDCQSHNRLKMHQGQGVVSSSLVPPPCPLCCPVTHLSVGITPFRSIPDAREGGQPKKYAALFPAHWALPQKEHAVPASPWSTLYTPLWTAHSWHKVSGAAVGSPPSLVVPEGALAGEKLSHGSPKRAENRLSTTIAGFSSISPSKCSPTDHQQGRRMDHLQPAAKAATHKSSL